MTSSSVSLNCARDRAGGSVSRKMLVLVRASITTNNKTKDFSRLQRVSRYTNGLHAHVPPGEEAKSEAKMKSNFAPSDTSVKHAP